MGETASVVEETPPDWGDEDSPVQDPNQLRARRRQDSLTVT